MIKKIIVAIVMLANSSCSGQDTVVCTNVMKGMTYVLRFTSDGTATLTAVTAVVSPGGTPPPPPPPPSTLRTIARDATRAVQDPAKATNGPRIAAVYRALATVADQMTSAAGANELLNRLLDASIGSDVKALWRPVAVAVAGAMPAFSPAAYRAAYTSIAEGIEDGLGMARAGDGKPGYISDRFWELLLAILKILIPLLFPPGQDVGMIDTHGGVAESQEHELTFLMPPRRLNVDAADRPVTRFPISPTDTEDRVTDGSQLISNPSFVREPVRLSPQSPPARFSARPELIRMWLDMQEAEERPRVPLRSTSMINSEWRPIAIAPRRSAAACAT